jgi:K+-transporting ATPase ATPase C chain
MTGELRPLFVVFVMLTLLTGVVYPLAVTAVAQVAFPWQANGSLVGPDGEPTAADGTAAVGSALIGQQFSSPRYFWGRLSATGPIPYNAAASSGSNLGPLNPALADAATARRDALQQAGDPAGKVPVDLLTASGSGLDPHLSVAGARFQAARVARARGLELHVVDELVQRYTEGRTFGVLGEPRVNVLLLNLALDRLRPEQTLRGSAK